ncbi:CRISPR-associated helicase Cas3' [Streptomyces cacaoi]|uniref:CRISPR-associated helicase Cas3' n=1 Tax=Streptomyces cacaoi TaxID=1898 RepID=UPI00261F3CBF|nr:CRISPR-associated helicase Cas3' [Streptomyces cacaoi]
MYAEREESRSSPCFGSVSAVDVARRSGLEASCLRQLGVLWGKSAAYGGGRVNLLISHLLDTAAVAEMMWQEFLAPSVRDMLNRISGGDGRRFFMWLCGVHDVGKATPAYQSMDEAGAHKVRAAGLRWRDGALAGRSRRKWRHDKAGGRILRTVLPEHWSTDAVEWVWPLVAGHHGTVPPVSVFQQRGAKVDQLHGAGAEWRNAQRNVVEVFSRCLGYEDLSAVEPVEVPSRAEQLSLCGLVMMADWIASDTRDGHFRGLDQLEDVGLEPARQRAERAWRALKLRGGWGRLSVPVASDLVQHRFGEPARASQACLVEVAGRLPGPGLVFVEAPMGEGKTKGTLAAAEVLAARFGADGVFVGMPTQATCDPMYKIVRDWVESIEPGLGEHVALLHGKRAFNPLWRGLWKKDEGAPETWYGSVGEDEFGLDEFGMGSGGGSAQEEPCCYGGSGPSEWFLDRKRGLLSPFVVGTIDQLLFAATRTKHVMLRFAGLAGKVVILDEVHAADVYMRQFLAEALRWLGQAGVPAVLLSATLPPAQRRLLARAYLEGAVGRVGVEVAGMPEPQGYPSATAVYADESGTPAYLSESAAPWRTSQPVEIGWLPDVSADGSAVVERVETEVADGGVALVVLNTVKRAQQVHRRLAESFPGETVLLHGRVCAADRAERTERCLAELGPDDDVARPGRRIVVATQLAEQSFDVDADVLVTDLAPVDLLLQRIGRLHRHEHTYRPAHLRDPRVLVSGVAGSVEGRAPVFLGASEKFYGRYLLLRTTSVLARAAGSPPPAGGAERSGGALWSVPAQVPSLVAEVYGEERVCEPFWTGAEEQARERWTSQEWTRAASAEKFLLCQRGEWAKPTLAGLHYGGVTATDEELRDAVVRDGEMAAEVVLVKRDERGFRALDGKWLGVRGEACEHETAGDAAMGGMVRLPVQEGLGEAVDKELRPLEGWAHAPGLRFAKALVLEEDGFARLGGYRIGYHETEGLAVEDESSRGEQNRAHTQA